MATTFPFPPSPTVGQVVTLSSGEQMQWNGYTWVDVTGGVTYPITIAKGGTSATDAATARTNLGLNDPTTGYLPLVGGTLNPGPLTITNPNGAPLISLNNTKVGAGLGGNNIIGQNQGKSRWQMTMPGNDSETGNNAGSPFRLIGYDDAGTTILSDFRIERATSAVKISGNAPALVMYNTTAPVNQRIWNAYANLAGDWQVYCVNDAGTPITSPIFGYTRSSNKWNIDGVPIAIGITTNAATANTIAARDATGNFQVNDIYAVKAFGSAGGWLSSASFADTCLAHGFASANKANPYMRHTDSTVILLTVNPSDERMKDNIEPATATALPVIDSIPLIAFNWKPDVFDDPSVRHEVAFSAQKLQAVRSDFAGGTEEQMTVGQFVLPWLVKAVQELSARVQTLEGATP